MPDLDFQVTGVEARSRSITPLLEFNLRIRNVPDNETIHAVLLSAQVQIQCPRRSYSGGEREKLLDLFGPPESWGQTLRNRLWAQASATLKPFNGLTDALLPIPCTYDLNVAATKYFEALEHGEIPLLFLFSGSVFYAAADGRLQVCPISWNKECVYRLKLEAWKELMERHYPNTGWISMRREVVEKLSAYKRRQGLTNWEEAMERLMEAAAGATNRGLESGAREEVAA